MATVKLKFSQSVVDTNQNIRTQNGTPQNGSIGTVFDAIAKASSTLSNEYMYYTSWSLVGSTLRLNYGDGAYQIFTGVTLANPDAQSGTATATGLQFVKDGVISVAQAGLRTLQYEVSNSGDLSFYTTGNTTSAAKLTTLLPSYSAGYNAMLGNVSLGFEGHLVSTSSNATSGTVTAITTTADKYISSGAIHGHFDVSGNPTTIGQGLSKSSVSGTLESFYTDYRDGSHINVQGWSAQITSSQLIDEAMLGNAAYFGGDDAFDVSMPNALYGQVLLASGAGNDTLAIAGGGGKLHVDAGTGNDVIRVISGSHQIQGGAGTDTLIYGAAKSSYSLAKTDGGMTVTGSGTTDTVSGIERIHFADSAMAFDIDGNGGQAYRLYQAAFDRKPDSVGLGYWMAALDKQTSLRDVADSFIRSKEFVDLYGANPTNEAFVARLYNNVLHRAYEQEGYDYWVNVLSHGESRAAVLANFSEGAENQAQVLGVIQNGFEFTPFG